MEFVGRPGAPFGGRATEAEPVVSRLCFVAPVFGPVAELFGPVAERLDSVTELFGPVTERLGSVTELFGPIAFLLVLGSDAGISVGAAKPFVERCRAKLRRRNVAEVRRGRRRARSGRRPRVGRWLERGRRRAPPLTRSRPLGPACPCGVAGFERAESQSRHGPEGCAADRDNDIGTDDNDVF